MSHPSPKHTRLVFILIMIVIGMFGFGYALVPLYNVLCSAFGINGKTKNIRQTNHEQIDPSRTITVQFMAVPNSELHWTFRPLTREIHIHPGQSVKLAYYAQNNTDKTITVQAIPSVSPGLAAAHLKKTECFCFNKQTLGPDQSKKMPLIFHLDNQLPQSIHEITLSYSLFKVHASSKSGLLRRATPSSQ